MLRILTTSSGNGGNLKVLNTVMERSASLWINARKANRSLGQMAGGISAVDMGDADSWRIKILASDDLEAAVDARPDEKNALFKGTQFRLLNLEGKWLISNAGFFR